MRSCLLAIALAGSILLPAAVFGQTDSGPIIDPSISPIDVESKARVQDVDHPDSALLPGGSNAWSGQPIMRQTPPAAAQKNPGSTVNLFPSLVGMSAWGTSTLANVPAADTEVVRSQTAKLAMKSDLSRKLDTTLALIDLYSPKSILNSDELALALAGNLPTRTSAALELRRIRQDAARSARSARTRITNPLQATADAASAGHWHSDESSIYALAQRQENSDFLLHYGFNAQNKPRRRHRKTHTLGQHDW